MTKGAVSKAERIALNEFDKWNDVAGVIHEGSGYYFEMESVIKDAVHIGIQMAIHGKVFRDEEGNIKYEG